MYMNDEAVRSVENHTSSIAGLWMLQDGGEISQVEIRKYDPVYPGIVGFIAERDEVRCAVENIGIITNAASHILPRTARGCPGNKVVIPCAAQNMIGSITTVDVVITATTVQSICAGTAELEIVDFGSVREFKGLNCLTSAPMGPNRTVC